MSSERTGRSRLITAAAWLVLLLGLWLWSRGFGTDSGALVNGATAAQVLQSGPPAARPLPASEPVRLDVASAGVQAPVIHRGLDKAGAVDSPPFTSSAEVGWYRGGAEPGARGVAVFVGHMDTASRPAVFYRLSDVRPGERVRVPRADGTTAVFTVERVETVTRDSFDARRVYGEHKRGRAEIRLLTCGGMYEPMKKRYTGNLVVSGYLTGSG